MSQGERRERWWGGGRCWCCTVGRLTRRAVRPWDWLGAASEWAGPAQQGRHSRHSRRGPTHGWRGRAAPPLSRRWKSGPEELLRSRRGDSFASSLPTTVAGSCLSSPGKGSLSSRADDRLCIWESCCAPPALQPADGTAAQPAAAAWGLLGAAIIPALQSITTTNPAHPTHPEGAACGGLDCAQKAFMGNRYVCGCEQPYAPALALWRGRFHDSLRRHALQRGVGYLHAVGVCRCR
jgi:hypothetical protein